MAEFAIQHASEIQDGGTFIIHANHLIDNFNAIISDLGDRLSKTTGSAQSITGAVTFASGSTFTNGLTSNGTVTLASTVSVTGTLGLARSADPTTQPAGSIWYNSTSNQFKAAIQATTITNATNATPIVVTTAGAHGLATGGTAYISGVVGNTAANGNWTVTVTDTVTFSLNTSIGNGAYSSGGTVTVPKQVLTAGYIPSSNKGAIFGLILSNNAGTPTTDIDITAGQCMDDTNTDLMVYAGGTKRFSSVFVVGTGNGASDTGTIPTSGTLHVYVIKRVDTGVVDLFCSTSLTPTLPTSYTLKRRIGSLTTDASSHMMGFKQCPVNPDRFEYTTPGALDVDVTNQSTTAVTRTLAVPTGIQVEAILNTYVTGTGVLSVYFRNLDLADIAPSTTASPLAQITTANGAAQNGGGQVRVITNTSGQISTRSTGASTTLKIVTIGWIDRRGGLN